MAAYVFLHGGGQGGWVWDETIAAIGRQSGGEARCLALDAPGCGAKRGVDTAALSFEDITADLIADIVASGLTGVTLVGHSQAGLHIPHLVEQAPPGLVDRVVYVSCSAPLAGMTTLD